MPCTVEPWSGTAEELRQEWAQYFSGKPKTIWRAASDRAASLAGGACGEKDIATGSNPTDLEAYRVKPGLDIWVVPNFAQDHLGFDPAELQRALQENYPVVGKGGAITPATAQWVDGANQALNYRGNELKRSKMWFQRGDPATCGYVKYYYTGWQNDILPATSDIASCPEVAPVADQYDAWAARVGFPRANHYIVTKYVDGAHNIGWQESFALDKSKICLVDSARAGVYSLVV